MDGSKLHNDLEETSFLSRSTQQERQVYQIAQARLAPSLEMIGGKKHAVEGCRQWRREYESVKVPPRVALALQADLAATLAGMGFENMALYYDQKLLGSLDKDSRQPHPMYSQQEMRRLELQIIARHTADIKRLREKLRLREESRLREDSRLREKSGMDVASWEGEQSETRLRLMASLRDNSAPAPRLESAPSQNSDGARSPTSVKAAATRQDQHRTLPNNTASEGMEADLRNLLGLGRQGRQPLESRAGSDPLGLRAPFGGVPEKLIESLNPPLGAQTSDSKSDVDEVLRSRKAAREQSSDFAAYVDPNRKYREATMDRSFPSTAEYYQATLQLQREATARLMQARTQISQRNDLGGQQPDTASDKDRLFYLPHGVYEYPFGRKGTYVPENDGDFNPDQAALYSTESTTHVKTATTSTRSNLTRTNIQAGHLLATQSGVMDGDGWLKKFVDTNDLLSPAMSSDRVRIAVLDTGCDLHNSYFSVFDVNGTSQSLGRYWHDCLGESQTPIDEDGTKHGTAIAILLCQLLRATAEIHIFRVARSSDSLGFNSEPVKEAIRLASSRGIEIVSMSFGFTEQVQSIKKAILESEEKCNDQILFFAAANNDGLNEPERFPASFESVISVRGTDHTGAIVGKFNPGNWAHKGGDQLCTLAQDVPCGIGELKSGCSMVTPIMAAIAAAIIRYVDREEGFTDGQRDQIRTRRGMCAVLEKMSSPTATRRLYVALWQLFEGRRTPYFLIGNALQSIP